MNEAPKVGQLIDGVARRDAIHVAVAPVMAGDRIEPGKHVGFGGNGLIYQGMPPLIGIADPFLKKPIEKGDRFWLFLYPGTITSLRHVWTHPAFATTLKKEESNAAG